MTGPTDGAEAQRFAAAASGVSLRPARPVLAVANAAVNPTKTRAAKM